MVPSSHPDVDSLVSGWLGRGLENITERQLLPMLYNILYSFLSPKTYPSYACVHLYLLKSKISSSEEVIWRKVKQKIMLKCKYVIHAINAVIKSATYIIILTLLQSQYHGYIWYEIIRCTEERSILLNAIELHRHLNMYLNSNLQ